MHLLQNNQDADTCNFVAFTWQIIILHGSLIVGCYMDDNQQQNTFAIKHFDCFDLNGKAWFRSNLKSMYLFKHR